MKPEQAELFLIEELFSQSQGKGVAQNEKLDLVDKLTGDASTRRYYRLFTDKNSYVVCLDNPQNDSEATHPFVSKQSFLKNAGVRVPGVLDTQLAKGYILEEDLGDVTLLSHLATIGDEAEERALYLQVIKQLLPLHRLNRETSDKSGLFNLSFDYEKYMQEMDFTFKFFFGHFLKFTDEDVKSKIRNELDLVCTRLASQPMVLTHRDFHSRNIMVKSKELIFIDFQDARWGIPQYDLVSLLEDCYYELTDLNREYLKKYYFENLPSSAHGQSDWKQFCDFYDDMLIQRVFKAVGSFAYIYATRQDARYLKYIGFGMEKIRQTMMKHERYHNLRKYLFEVYYAG
ncbi:MAG: phosphotransferase [Bacteriovoracaceae bacterium]|nr:phosphotransferase [Bacteriovoracaceae bacterium]